MRSTLLGVFPELGPVFRDRHHRLPRSTPAVITRGASVFEADPEHPESLDPVGEADQVPFEVAVVDPHSFLLVVSSTLPSPGAGVVCLIQRARRVNVHSTVPRTVTEDFKTITGELTRAVTQEELAVEIGVARNTVARGRLDPDSDAYRTPPPGWRVAVAMLARKRAAELMALAVQVKGGR